MNPAESPHNLGRLLLVALAMLVLTASASAEWNEKVLYSFQGGSDGATPAGGVVFDSQGNLYGATSGGGSGSCAGFFQCGTVYQLSPPAQKGGPWTQTVIHNFQGNKSGDGTSPGGGLVIDKAGNLYGTTGYGGTGGCVLLGSKEGCGTVYELSPPKVKGGAWTEKVLYSFKGGKDGYVPDGDLVFDIAGNLYGATLFGGGKGTSCNSLYQYCGTVFELSPPQQKGGKWTEKVLHGFKGGTDGANPNGGLVFDNKGVIFGTTYSGGNQTCKGDGYLGCGTAFRLIPPIKKGGAWTETALHRFAADNDGAGPLAGLVLDSENNAYGTTNGGGTAGVAFKLAPPQDRDRPWKETIIHDFGSIRHDAELPGGGLIADAKGDLYGAAPGGAHVRGAVYRLKPPTKRGGAWAYAILYNLGGTPDGYQPESALTFDNAGNLYGTTEFGGVEQQCQQGCGTVFGVQP